MPDRFGYKVAFSRNIGWLTEWEQTALRHKTIAIAGLGGVGGIYLQTLARLGVGSFHIADLDRFELANFNRQVGAKISTLGQSKVEVMAREALEINPDIRLKSFPDGIRDDNIDMFLKGVDLFVDGFDFFELPIRRKVFARCWELGIPAVTAAPVGMGSAYLIFMPGGMSFEDYFQFSGLSPEKQYVNFLLGVAPKGLHARYLVDPSRADFERRMAPSTIMGVTLSAGIVGAEAVKILLGRGKVRPAPWSHHFDPYLGRYATQYLPWGNKNPWQALKRHIGYRRFARFAQMAKTGGERPPRSVMEDILDLARWAPSGDNTQPWRFEIVDKESVVIHVRDQADIDVYDYNHGQPSLISAGALIESMAIAASRYGRSIRWNCEKVGEHRYALTVKLPVADDIAEDPLIAYLPMRSVNRGGLSRRRLDDAAKERLAAALGPNFDLLWHEALGERWAMSRINAAATRIRLSVPEALTVHQRIIDWRRRFSPDGVPAGAVGLDPLARRIMKWALAGWPRTRILNRFLGGTLLARLEMDILPGVACGAHFTICARADMGERRIPDLIEAGRRIQRFWLTATREGLGMQPAIAPLIFGFYGRHQIAFTTEAGMLTASEGLAGMLAKAYGRDGDRLLFRGRIGYAKPGSPGTRSVRRPLEDLLVDGSR